MPPYITSQAACVLNIWRDQSCRYLALDKLSKTLHQRCFGPAKCQGKVRNDHPNIRIKSRSEFNSASPESATFTSKAETSNNPRTAPDIISSAQKQSNLTTPIIVLIILFVIISLLFLLFLFWRRRSGVQYFDNSIIKKREITTGRPLSLESTLLNHNRGSVESNAPSSVRSISSSLSLEDVPISDVEKELIVEPSLKTHPAFKFIDVTNPYPHHPGTRVAIPEIPSPLPSPVHQTEKMSKHMSHHSLDKAESAIARKGSVRKNSSANIDSSLWSEESPDRDDSSVYSCESSNSYVEPITPSSFSEKGHQARCEIIKEESDKASVQDECSKIETDSETYPWHELFSKITRSKSPESRIKDINHVVNKSSSGYHKKAAHITQDNSDQIHLISNNRWSNSSDDSPDSLKDTASDWYIPGSWINSTRLDDDNTCKNETSSGYDTSDAILKSKSQKFIYLNLRSENSSPNSSMLDCSEKIIAKSEYDNDKNNKLEAEVNDSEIEKSETKIWRRWLKR